MKNGMNRFWNWLQDRLGIHGLGHRLTTLEDEVARLRKKVRRPSQRYDQIQRARSKRQHPARHH